MLLVNKLLYIVKHNLLYYFVLTAFLNKCNILNCKCAELLAKRYGILTDKTKIEGNIPVVITNDLTD